MYAGQNNTELCPTRIFTGEPLYRDGQAPDDAEIAPPRRRPTGSPITTRCATNWRACRRAHGHAVLFDGHSIKSELPWLFEGTLPHMNLGTVGGTQLRAGAARRAGGACSRRSARYSTSSTAASRAATSRASYGRPPQGVHAVQLEMCWRAYMDETPPYRWHEARAAEVHAAAAPAGAGDAGLAAGA